MGGNEKPNQAKQNKTKQNQQIYFKNKY